MERWMENLILRLFIKFCTILYERILSIICDWECDGIEKKEKKLGINI